MSADSYGNWLRHPCYKICTVCIILLYHLDIFRPFEKMLRLEITLHVSGGPFATMLSLTRVLSSTIFSIFRAIWYPFENLCSSITKTLRGQTLQMTDSKALDTSASSTSEIVSCDVLVDLYDHS